MPPKKLCTYCDELATTRDHVPPKCFFTERKPDNLITVPCCLACNKFYGDAVDTHARNTIAALHTNERHWAVSQELAGRRDRSYKKKSENLDYMGSIITPKEVHSSAGIYLGVAPALNLNNPVMNKFFERLARGLTYVELGIRSVDSPIRWGLVDVLLRNAGGQSVVQGIIGPSDIWRSIGHRTFTYWGWNKPDDAFLMWIVQFYGGEQFFMSVLGAKSIADASSST